ncbi:EamA family transporter [Propionicimonas sp.]|uniref:EamA family transporter n=1 Tax=Propionicimonas sp. TaxID=1955623 RepID=UPI00185EED4D|nr:EamA family transporter [Propionicimonas sp.]MBU3977858.1 EamA family transporter [Actinomycetota bacterium]MBA3021918.1 EamA family transporter [Propionicimonas sp.]MBU3987635.1 EamA family transporter [Actinomycetota bacterium]MBU4007357.1 EamA family transporter [Actinomycetota bacterium]MBU4065697.1 EamA family transporter [Actinomycetota bacterium]
MPVRHRLLAIAVAVIWGINFLAIHLSLAAFPPFFLVALRFALIALPTLMFVPRPDVPLRWLVGYGLGFGVAQFTFLYWGMAAGMPTGLASLVLQSSAPFTLVLGVLLLGERVRTRQWIGIAVAVAGMALVGWSRAQAAALLPFLLVLAGALGWAFGNLSSRLAKPTNPLHLTLWMSVVVPVPMLALSLVFEGPDQIATAVAGSLSADALPAWGGLLYTCLIATVVGSGLWTWLLSRHPAGVVAPFSMLVPVAGIITAALVLGEWPTWLELVGGVVVVAGVLVGARRPKVLEPEVSVGQPRPVLVATQD